METEYKPGDFEFVDQCVRSVYPWDGYALIVPPSNVPVPPGYRLACEFFPAFQMPWYNVKNDYFDEGIAAVLTRTLIRPRRKSDALDQ